MLFWRTYPALNGRQVRRGMRQSMPHKSIASCAGLTLTSPFADDGQTKLCERMLKLIKAQRPGLHKTLDLEEPDDEEIEAAYREARKG